MVCKMCYEHTHSGNGGMNELTLIMVPKVYKNGSLSKMIARRPPDEMPVQQGAEWIDTTVLKTGHNLEVEH